jgi:pyruvate dehydrogenase E2 component (dihydrolipoamide acetyltransferase)
MAEYRLPSLGADMESAKLTEWLVKPGDSVKRGDLVASVETSKGIIDIEIFEAGRIEQLLVQPGTQVPVGAVLATYTAAGGAPQPAVAPSAPTPAMRAVEPRALRAAPPAPTPAREPTTAPRARVSPAARRRAQELGIDLAALAATGPEGAVTIEDVERTARETAAPLADMRSVIGQAMSRAKREIPHYYLATTIDMRAALAWLERWNATHPVTERLLYSALLVKALARALEKSPELNGFWLDGRFEESREINVGIAIRLRQGGLVAPGLPAANEQTLPALMQQLQGLVQRARAGRLRRSEITNATITLSSLGEGGVETLYPIIYPPQVAIAGFGSILTRPWHVAGEIVAAPVINATLSADHRVSDGHRGSQFLTEVDRLLQQPERL